MGVTSVIYNGVHTIPLKFNVGLNTTPNSSSTSLFATQFSHRPCLMFRSAIHSRKIPLPNFSVVYAKSTKEEDGTSTASEWHGDDTGSRPSSSGSKSHLSTSVGCVVKEKHDQESYMSSVRTVALCVSTAVAFGIGLGFTGGVGKATEFFAGYLLEQSLSVDNLFVFVLVFKYFKVPIMYQNRVLSYGIAGAVIFRSSLILLGTATLQRFEVVNLLLAAILLYSSFKLFSTEEEDEDLSENFIVKACQKVIPVTANYDGNRFFTIDNGVWKATPLLLTVAVIEVDSIPAVFGVTRDPFIVFSSNLFAILGLRSLYTLISESMADLEYLQPSIAVVLGFIGLKMILDYFGFHVGTEVSLGFVATSLTTGVLLSLVKKSE
ncbi:thylakoid membrane protein TERC, chloroplastic isoform X2 [Spinacia oleracea]|uniref:Thylakoid membrane protein TERC, chloroplastic isoform X2 n=1 Tax=Spinacia oleracea TaxID=3562 RepID=A0ABM3QP26_SPIOL|nr:thylakoid membrane protein TERC, chloroplastic isoform X2 [Spinacia oleracea]